MNLRLGCWLAAWLCIVPVTSYAEQVRTITGPRIHMSDIVEGAPEAIAALDFGPAPAPGASRVVTRSEVESRLRRLGHDPGSLAIQDSVRLVTQGREVPPEDVAREASSVIRSVLPPGITLLGVEPAPRAVLVPVGASLTSALLPQFPRRAGRVRVTITVEFVDDGKVAARVPLSASVQVSEEAARPDVAKGTTIRLLLTRGAVTITAPGVLLADANVGDTVRATIRPTGKTVRVVVTSPDSAKVTEP